MIVIMSQSQTVWYSIIYMLAWNYFHNISAPLYNFETLPQNQTII